jgi:hypothetical protein
VNVEFMKLRTWMMDLPDLSEALHEIDEVIEMNHQLVPNKRDNPHYVDALTHFTKALGSLTLSTRMQMSGRQRKALLNIAKENVKGFYETLKAIYEARAPKIPKVPYDLFHDQLMALTTRARERILWNTGRISDHLKYLQTFDVQNRKGGLLAIREYRAQVAKDGDSLQAISSIDTVVKNYEAQYFGLVHDEDPKSALFKAGTLDFNYMEAKKALTRMADSIKNFPPQSIKGQIYTELATMVSNMGENIFTKGVQYSRDVRERLGFVGKTYINTKNKLAIHADDSAIREIYKSAKETLKDATIAHIFDAVDKVSVHLGLAQNHFTDYDLTKSLTAPKSSDNAHVVYPAIKP